MSSEKSDQPVVVAWISHVDDYQRLVDALDWSSPEHLAELGILQRRISRGVDDANEVFVEFEMRSFDHARQLMLEGDELRAWLDRAGLGVYPPVFVGRETTRVRFAAGSGPDVS